MFVPQLATAGAARASQVGAWLAPKAVQYGPKVLKVAKTIGKIVTQYVKVSLIVDVVVGAGLGMGVLVKRRSEKDPKASNAKVSFSVSRTVRKGAQVVQNVAKFLASGFVQAVAEIAWWLSLIPAFAGMLGYILGVLLVAMPVQLITRLITLRKRNSRHTANRAYSKAVRPFKWFFHMSLYPIKGATGLSRRFGAYRNRVLFDFLNELIGYRLFPLRDAEWYPSATLEEEIEVHTVHPESTSTPKEGREMVLDTEEHVDTPPDKPMVSGSKEEIKIVLDVQEIQKNPKRYGRELRGRVLAVTGDDPGRYRDVLRKDLQRVDLTSRLRALVMAGFDDVSEATGPRVAGHFRSV